MEQKETEPHPMIRRHGDKQEPFYGFLVYAQLEKGQTGRMLGVRGMALAQNPLGTTQQDPKCDLARVLLGLEKEVTPTHWPHMPQGGALCAQEAFGPLSRSARIRLLLFTNTAGAFPNPNHIDPPS